VQDGGIGGQAREGIFGDVVFGSSVMVTREAIDCYQDREIEAEALANLRRSLADQLVKKKVQVINTEFHREYRLHLYLFTSEELSRLIDVEYIRAKRG
jgi:hypothetical protein